MSYSCSVPFYLHQSLRKPATQGSRITATPTWEYGGGGYGGRDPTRVDRCAGGGLGLTVLQDPRSVHGYSSTSLRRPWLDGSRRPNRLRLLKVKRKEPSGRGMTQTVSCLKDKTDDRRGTLRGLELLTRDRVGDLSPSLLFEFQVHSKTETTK